MPQRKEINWSQLRVGILVAVSLVVLAVGVFLISGQMGFLSRRYTLKTYLSDASGLREGSQVQLAGIPIGNVEAIRVSSYTEPLRAVEIDMKVPRRSGSNPRRLSRHHRKRGSAGREIHQHLARQPGPARPERWCRV